MIHIQEYKSPVGELIIGVFNDQLVLADWKYRRMRTTIDSRIQKNLQAQYSIEKHPLIDLTIHQLEDYFNQKSTQFNLPLHFVGTTFQQEVWQELCRIPFGKTESYLSLSQKLNNEKAIRAVASANGANAISIIVPCHRIIGADGDLVGYAGGLPAKKKLLMLENALPNQNQLELF